MCILFEICKKTPFQKCMGWGGGGGFSQRSTTHWTVHTNMALHRSSIFIQNHCHRQHSLFQAGLALGQTSPVWTGTYIFNFCQSCNLRAFTGTQPSLRGTGQQKRWPQQSSEWHAPCGSMQVAVSGRYGAFFARLPGSCRVTCTHSAPPERALLCVSGFCGASGEAAARGVNLYEDMAAAC